MMPEIILCLNELRGVTTQNAAGRILGVSTGELQDKDGSMEGCLAKTASPANKG